MIKVLLFLTFFSPSFADTPAPPNNFLRSADTVPSNPPSGKYKFYVKTSDGLAYTKNSSGTETALTTSPGGSTTQVQYNNSSAFAGSALMRFDGTNLLLGSGTPSVGLLSIRSNAQDHIWLQKTSSFQSYILGVTSTSAFAIHDYTNGRDPIKIDSGASTSSIYIRDSSTGTIEFGQNLDINSNQIAEVGNIQLGDGAVGTPSLRFTNDGNSGLYLVAANNPALAVDGVQAFNCKKSTSSFGNCGFGGASSTSDNYPLILQRSVSGGGVFIAVENTNTGTNSKSCISLPANNNNNSGEICMGAPGSVDILDEALRIRVTGTGKGIFYDAGEQSTGFHEFRVGGDPLSTGTALKINANESTTFYGPPIIQVQGAGSTPTCDSARNGGLALTSGYILCVCRGGGTQWERVSDGTTDCTF